MMSEFPITDDPFSNELVLGQFYFNISNATEGQYI